MKQKLNIGSNKKKLMTKFLVNFGSKTKSIITNPYFYIKSFQKNAKLYFDFWVPKKAVCNAT